MTNTTSEQVGDSFTASTKAFQILAWVFFVGLIINGGKNMSSELMALDTDVLSFLDLFKGFWIAFLNNLPTFLLAWAIVDLAWFYGRCAEGEVFTRRNVKTLKVSAESLFWAALVSAVIAPTVISWLEREPRGILWETNDLTFGVAAIGVALYGFAIVLVKAVDLKEENDEMV